MFNLENPNIFFLCFLISLVTRSQTRHLIAHNIRECFVAIRPNFAAIALRWLQQNEPNPPASASTAPAVPVAPAATANNNANSSVPTVPKVAQQIKPNRRASVASGRNMFDVGGRIVEVGFDHLSRMQPGQTHEPQPGPSREVGFDHNQQPGQNREPQAGPSREIQNSNCSTSDNANSTDAGRATRTTRQNDATKCDEGIAKSGASEKVPVDSGNFKFKRFKIMQSEIF